VYIGYSNCAAFCIFKHLQGPYQEINYTLQWSISELFQSGINVQHKMPKTLQLVLIVYPSNSDTFHVSGLHILPSVWYCSVTTYYIEIAAFMTRSNNTQYLHYILYLCLWSSNLLKYIYIYISRNQYQICIILWYPFLTNSNKDC